jgi:hypothetical protein
MDQRQNKPTTVDLSEDTGAGRLAKSVLRKDKHLNKAYPLSEADDRNFVKNNPETEK